jgi:hypothetical protein
MTLLVLLGGNAAASPASYDLVPPRRCLAGSWGDASSLEWRVQLGVFDDADGADRFIARLARRGIAAERYAGAWLVGDDREPQVVVSATLPASAAARKKAVARHRRVVADAFARRYRVWG